MKENKTKKIARCFIINEGKVLLLFKKKRRHYEMPGGKVDEGESVDDAAKRECLEEVGCNVLLKEKFGPFYFNLKPFNIENHVFLAEIKKGESPKLMEPSVFDHFIWMPLNEFENYNLATSSLDFIKFHSYNLDKFK